MKITVDSRITKHFPKLLIGVVVAKGINNKHRVSATQQLLDGVCAQIQKKFTEENLNDEKVRVWRDVYKSFGANPKKYPSSIEALLKRVIKGNTIGSINTLVDVYNYLSLKNWLPFGGEDLDKVCGDVRLTYANGNEPFVKLGSDKVEYVPKGEIVYCDDAGITCRRWNYRECNRTKFTNETRNAAIIIENMGVLNKEEMKKTLEETRNFIKRYCGGEAEIAILSAERPSVETGIIGQKGVNDDPDAPSDTKVDTDGPQEVEFGTSIKLNEEDECEKAEAKEPEKKEESVVYDIWKRKILRSLTKAIERIFPDETPEVELFYPRDDEEGDYYSEIAIGIAEKIEKNPRETAEKIAEEVGKIPGIEKLIIAETGRMSFLLSDTSLNNEINKIVGKRSAYGESKIGEGKTVVVEYSSPNTACPLLTEHLSTTITGDAVSRVLKAVGYEVARVNHIGDWGEELGKLLCAYKGWGDRKLIEYKGAAGLMKLYEEFLEKSKEDKSLLDKADHEFKKLKEGNIENRQLWNWLISLTSRETDSIYERLGISFDAIIGESFYEDKENEVIAKGMQEELFEETEKGRVAAMKYRVDRWQPEKLIYVLDKKYGDYLEKVFAAAKKMGLNKGAEMVHLKLGEVLVDGTKTLEGVLDEAVRRARVLIETNNAELDGIRKKAMAEKLGIGAVRYYLLSHKIGEGFKFEWEKVFDEQGNSGLYLQQVTTKAYQLLEGNSNDVTSHLASDINEGKNNQVIKLKRLLPRYSEILIDAGHNYELQLLTNYINDVAGLLKGLCEEIDLKKIDLSKNQKLKFLVQAGLQIVENGLQVMGIKFL